MKRIILLLVILAGALGLWYWYEAHGSNKVTIDYVTIQTGMNESRNYPLDFAAVANGRYAYIDTSVPSSDPVTVLGGKLLYDGRVIYDDADLESVSEVISDNGLHYAYLRYDNGNVGVYVDNKLVKTLPDQQPKTVALYAVSNNGKDYAYEMLGTQNVLYRDGTALYSTTGNLINATFSDNLTHYAVITQIGMNPTIFKDGVNLGSGRSAYISPDGSHDILFTEMGNNNTGSVVADNKTVGTLDAADLNSTVINNNGSYAFTDFANHLVNINGRVHSIPTKIPTNCEQVCVNLFAINQDATHYIVGDYKPVGSHQPVWDLDGRQVILAGDIDDVTFSGNKLYVYRWSQ